MLRLCAAFPHGQDSLPSLCTVAFGMQPKAVPSLVPWVGFLIKLP